MMKPWRRLPCFDPGCCVRLETGAGGQEVVRLEGPQGLLDVSKPLGPLGAAGGGWDHDQ